MHKVLDDLSRSKVVGTNEIVLGKEVQALMFDEKVNKAM